MANGYCFVFVNGKSVRRSRYLMSWFLGRKLTSNEVVHHKDGNKTNDDMPNLQLMIVSEHNRMSGRATLTGAKLQKEDIPVIRKMLKDKIREWVIGLAYGVSHATIGDIKTGKSWSWI